MKTQTEYQAAPDECPRCNCQEIIRGSRTMWDVTVLNAKCLSCHLKWHEEYRFTGFKIIAEPDTTPTVHAHSRILS